MNGTGLQGLASLSEGWLLVVAFPRNRSPSYAIAKHLVSQASGHQDLSAGKTIMHVGTFGRSAPQAEAAISLLDYLDEIKGVQVYAGGRLRPDHEAVAVVLRCFLNSETAADRSAYCHQAIDDPFPVRADLDISRFSLDGARRYLFPCSFLLRHGFAIDGDHPSTPQTQIQAAGIRAGCDWCPMFNQNDFLKIGENK